MMIKVFNYFFQLKENNLKLEHRCQPQHKHDLLQEQTGTIKKKPELTQSHQDCKIEDIPGQYLTTQQPRHLTQSSLYSPNHPKKFAGKFQSGEAQSAPMSKNEKWQKEFRSKTSRGMVNLVRKRNEKIDEAVKASKNRNKPTSKAQSNQILDSQENVPVLDEQALQEIAKIRKQHHEEMVLMRKQITNMTLSQLEARPTSIRNPRGQVSGDQDLNFLQRNLRQKFPPCLMKICFNRSSSDMEEIAQLHQLAVCQPSAEVLPYWTWQNQTNGRIQRKTLDYFCSNFALQDLQNHCNIVDSDHLLITSTIKFSNLKQESRPLSRKIREIISPKITEDDILNIINNDNWPNKSFFEIAKSQNLTCIHNLKHTQYEQAKKLIKQFKKLEEQTRLLQQVKITISICKSHQKDSLSPITTLSDIAQRKRKLNLMANLKKIVPILFRQGNASIFRGIMDQLRKFLSKSFFVALSKIAATKKSSLIAHRFASKRQNDFIVEQISIEAYIQQLYTSEFQQDINPVEVVESTIVLDDAHINKAVHKLSKDKASGIDNLQDHWIKNPLISPFIKPKLLDIYQKWIDGEPVPQYLRTGRIFCLSNEHTEYPKVGGIRTISILPTTTKVYEQVLLQELHKEIQRLGGLPSNQRGFFDKFSTFDNLIDMFGLIRGGINIHKEYRRRKTKVSARYKQYLLFIDYQKAFDRVDRGILYQKMLDKGYNPQLVSAIQNLTQDTWMQYNQTEIRSNVGAPQGSCISPTLWNIYISDLCSELMGLRDDTFNNWLSISTGIRTTQTRFFADDLVVYCQGERQLERICQIINSWSETNRIKVNKQKSGVLQLRVDNRTPMPYHWDFYGIPLLQEYKYLGVVITDTLKFQLNNEELKNQEKKLSKIDWVLKNNKLDGLSRWQIFQAIFRSKLSYASNIISGIDKETLERLKSFWYQSLKKMLRIDDKVDKEKFLEVCLGKNFQEFQEQETKNTIGQMLNQARARQDFDREDQISKVCEGLEIQLPDRDTYGNFKFLKYILPVKQFLARGLAHQLKWRLGAANNQHGRENSENNSDILVKCPCNSSLTITQTHLEICPIYKRTWDEHAQLFGLTKAQFIRKIRSFNFMQPSIEEILTKIEEFKSLVSDLGQKLILAGQQAQIRSNQQIQQQ